MVTVKHNHHNHAIWGNWIPCSYNIIVGVLPPRVILSSNLIKEGIAYDTQIVIFTCTTRGMTLIWRSNDYISGDLNITSTDNPGMLKSSPTHPTTIAILTNVTTDANTGETVMVSELHIRASAQYPNSSISCGNDAWVF